MKDVNIPLIIMLSVLLLAVFSMSLHASTTCTMDDCRITITINLAFSGASQDYIDKIKDEIEDVWNGPDGFRTTGECNCMIKYEVNAMMITNASQMNCSPGPTGYHCIKVTPYNTNPPKAGNDTYIAFMWGITNGTSINGWWSDIVSRGIKGSNPPANYADAAHEAGHLMGLEDDYNKTSKTFGKNLMGQTWPPENKPTQAQIDKTVENVCGPDACPNYCCCGNGKIDKDKDEACDPFAEPDGCETNEYCCPICCQCYEQSCTPKNNEHDSKEECNIACEDDACYYNYQTGCWDCLKTKPIETPNPYGTTVKLVKGIFDEHTGLEGHKQITEIEIEGVSLMGVSEEVYEQVLQRNTPEVVGDLETAKVTTETAVNDAVQKVDLFEYMENMSLDMIEHPLLSGLFANERINIYVEDVSKEPYAYVIIEDGKITDVGKSGMDDPTINLYTDQDTIFMVATGGISIEQALDENRITYKGVGIVNSVKLGVLGFFYKIASFFSSEQYVEVSDDGMPYLSEKNKTMGKGEVWCSGYYECSCPDGTKFRIRKSFFGEEDCTCPRLTTYVYEAQTCYCELTSPCLVIRT